MDYTKDRFAIECLKLVNKCKSQVGFGAVLVKNGRILGRGWNRLSTAEERSKLSHVDYAIHAEQAAILDALSRNHTINEATVYVLGKALTGPNKGKLTHREKLGFGCWKCPNAFIRYNVNVVVSLNKNWSRAIKPQEAKEFGALIYHKNLWGNFVKKGLIQDG